MAPGQPVRSSDGAFPAVAGPWPHGRIPWIRVDAWWLLICWLLRYCACRALVQPHGAHCWMLQPLVYCIVLCAVGLPFVVLHPIPHWLPPFAVLAAISFRASVRKERSLWSDAA